MARHPVDALLVTSTDWKLSYTLFLCLFEDKNAPARWAFL